MRHAIAGLSAILLAGTAAASEEQVYYKITLTNGTLSIAPASTAAGRNDGRLQQINLQSLRWAVLDTQASGGGANQMVMNDTPGTESSEIMRKDLQAADRLGDQPASGGHGMPGASDKVTVGGSQTESGQATGKRQHMPIRARVYYDSPQGTGPGILGIKARYPGCTVGRRYGGIQVAAGGKTYRLQGVRIESCGSTAARVDTHEVNEIRFTYQKIVWD